MRRLFLRISLGILLALVVSAIAASQVLRSTADRRLHERIMRERRGQERFLVERLNRAPVESLTAEVEALRSLVSDPLVVVPIDDKSIPPDVRHELAVDRRAQRFTRAGMTIYFGIHRGRYVAILGPMGPPLPFHYQQIILVLVIVLPIVGAAGYLLAYPMARRLRDLEQAATRIGRGELDARAEVGSAGPVSELARRFNQMADRIETLLDDQRHLLQAVSHELRTPIARIQFSLEMLASAAGEADRAVRVKEIEGDLEELNTLVHELLLFVRFESEGFDPGSAEVDPAPVLRELVERNGGLYPGIAVDLRLPPDGEIRIRAQKPYFKRAIQNLLTNAMRYAQSTVVVSTVRADGGVVVEVADDGPGIAPHERERIFKPFTRLDDSRSRESGGAGLGLAIVDRILRAYGGSVSIEDAAGGGVRFITVWPAADR